MALIDRTYFIGDINIPNTGHESVGSLVDWYIEKYEEQFLTDALGYELYKALKAGLAEVSPEQKWIDLVQGVEYTNLQNRISKWRGLVSQPPAILNSLDALNTITIRPGGTGEFDPPTGQNVATIPPVLVGKDFIIEQRGIGQLRTDEYSIVGNQLMLLSSVFSSSDTYFYKSATLSINTSTGVNKESPIAMFVYYWFMRNNITQTTGGGEVQTANENSNPANAALKMQRAWNEMSAWVMDLRQYLDSNKSTYTDWKGFLTVYAPRYEYGYCYSGYVDKFKPMNLFNL